MNDPTDTITAKIRFAATRALRLVLWNLLLIGAAATLIFILAEAWFRLTKPYRDLDWRPAHFAPGVGLLQEPGQTKRLRDGLGAWVENRANSLGFLDREPPDPERAAQSCHIAIIGDSFVEGSQVPIADKFQVRLESLAAQALPRMNVTTSAFGIAGTGQVSQLPLWDEYAKGLAPKVLVLVFVNNDFPNNSKLLMSLDLGSDPDHMPYAWAEKTATGAIELRPPDPNWRSLAVSADTPLPVSASRFLTRRSLFYRYLNVKFSLLGDKDAEWNTTFQERVALLRQRPHYESAFRGWEDKTSAQIQWLAVSENPPPVFKEALEFTGFALDEFKRRADRDGVHLVILAIHAMGDSRNPLRTTLNDLATNRGIPVLSQHDHILRQGGAIEDAQWPYDGHWTPTGHQWAAEVLLDYLKQNPALCLS